MITTTKFRNYTQLGCAGLMVLAALAFGACGSDDNEEPTPTPETMKATSAQAEYVVNLSQDLVDAANVTIFYIDGNGQQAQENATTTTWTKTVSFAALPAQAGFGVLPRLKTGGTNEQSSQEEYAIEADGKMTLTVLDQKGATFGSPFVGSKIEVKGLLGPYYLGQYLTRISGRLKEAKSIAADGSLTDTTITWGGNADEDDPNRDTEVSSEGATGTTRG